MIGGLAPRHPRQETEVRRNGRMATQTQLQLYWSSLAQGDAAHPLSQADSDFLTNIGMKEHRREALMAEESARLKEIQSRPGLSDEDLDILARQSNPWRVAGYWSLVAFVPPAVILAIGLAGGCVVRGFKA
jgi:hypothetical protein